ncbi:hypothetical protein EUTSA_v10023951mg [Eutrema salsugineum]|uniref:ADP-ribosyl cyclase/cyclic ADP-ribose hydrolase n=1 Tax=Eutrema salsugineum TaxID=72664 RepID=V4KGQ2_EUTSA|nr:hypothetical protein EUTSA_v10023951mg [Eutrema salsugineum]
MASPSCLTTCNYKFKVFSSFHGPDVRKTLLSHLREQFNLKGITMFNDNKIKRGEELDPSLKEAIRESKIWIVILSKKYASSSWCLDELVEILERKNAMKQIVMTVFYGVEPSDVRKHTGEFGIAFNETCARKTDEERQKWSKALTDVSNIAGEDFKNWDNEANMIKKIASDVSDKLNATPSIDFVDMVGIEAHLQKMLSLLHLDNKDEAMMVGISGPAGIGKTTIARALQSLLSGRFQLTCFVDNIRGSCHSGLDDYGMQLRLQEDLLSKLFNQDCTRISHLGVLQQRLSDLRVLVILDDVDDLKQLEALANEATWFGSGSRIVVTTENRELLQQHGINNTYHVGFPSDVEALGILCRYAFKQSSPPHGFEELAEIVTHRCGRLPLGLRVVGSSLRGKNEDEWKKVMRKLETVLNRSIEEVLRVGYESLDEDEQTLFLHIAVFFNYEDGDLVTTMFADSDLNVKSSLEILFNRSLIEISTYRETIEMHKLLQQMGRRAIQKQESWKRRILIDAQEICDVLENDTGTRRVVHKRRYNGNERMDIPEDMEFPLRLRLLHWEEYPSKSLPPTFHPQYLIKLDMPHSKLEKLWEGIQPLANLKEMRLSGSRHLKELPDLSNATNLETLVLSYCESLVKLPSSISNLPRIETLWMNSCTKLEVIPTNWNSAYLSSVKISGTNITTFDISVTLWYLRSYFAISLRHNGKLKTLTQLPTNIRALDLSYSGIERISSCCIKGLYMLRDLTLCCCRNLTSLPELPRSLQFLDASNCESLETIYCPSSTLDMQLNFTNCFKLGQQARRDIIQLQTLDRFQHGSSYLPGSEMPRELDHRAKGNTLIFPISAFSYFSVCLVIAPNQETGEYDDPYVFCRRIRKGYLYPIQKIQVCRIPSTCRTEHLFTFHSHLLGQHGYLEVTGEIELEFSSQSQDFDIIKCGAQILTYESDEEDDNDDCIPVRRSESESEEVLDDEEGYTYGN